MFESELSGDIVYKCKILEPLNMKGGAGNELYYCKYKDYRFGSPIPDNCIDCEKYEPDYSTLPETFLHINYIGDNTKNCCWAIICSDDIIEKQVLNKVEGWTKRHVESSAEIDFYKVEGREREYRLKIRGIGNDGRCTWCRSYRTALNTSTNNLPTTLKKCPYDTPKYDSQV